MEQRRDFRRHQHFTSDRAARVSRETLPLLIVKLILKQKVILHCHTTDESVALIDQRIGALRAQTIEEFIMGAELALP